MGILQTKFLHSVPIAHVRRFGKFLHQEYVTALNLSTFPSNAEHGTPLLMAIRHQNIKIVRYLIQRVKVSYSQTGLFTLNDFYSKETPPILAAFISTDVPIIRYFISSMRMELTFDEAFRGQIIENRLISVSAKINILEEVAITLTCCGYIVSHYRVAFQCCVEAMNLRLSTKTQETIQGSKFYPYTVLFNEFKFHPACRITRQNLETHFGTDVKQILEKVSKVMSYKWSCKQTDGRLINIIWEVFVLSCKENYLEYIDCQGEIVEAIVFMLNLFDHLDDTSRCSIPYFNSKVLPSIIYSGLNTHHVDNSSQEEKYFLYLIKVVDYVSRRPFCNEITMKENVIQWSSIYYLTILNDAMKTFSFRTKVELIQQFESSLYNFAIACRKWSPRRRTILHQICEHCFGISLIEKFLEIGIEPNALDNEGNTALHHLFELSTVYAYSLSDFILKTLLARGADICQRNNKNVSVLSMANKHSHIHSDFDFVCPSFFVPSLMSLCFIAISRNNIPIRKLPLHLQEFASRF